VEEVVEFSQQILYLLYKVLALQGILVLQVVEVEEFSKQI
jgi:hypothetical protein